MGNLIIKDSIISPRTKYNKYDNKYDKKYNKKKDINDKDDIYYDLNNLIYIRPNEEFTIPALYLNNSNNNKIIIYSHDYMNDISRCIPLLYSIHEELCINVISYDYTTLYKDNTIRSNNTTGSSSYSEKNLENYEILSHIYYYLIKVHNYLPSNIIIYGVGIGIFPTMCLANILSISETIFLKHVILEITNDIEEMRYINLLKSIKYPISILYNLHNEKYFNELVKNTQNLYNIYDNSSFNHSSIYIKQNEMNSYNKNNESDDKDRKKTISNIIKQLKEIIKYNN